MAAPASGAVDARVEAHVQTQVAAAQRGDETAFAALYDAHAGAVYALCVGLSGSRVTAAELVQDVFVRVWERIGSFRGECAFGTWLHRVAVNTVLEAKRRDGRRSLRVTIAADLQLAQGDEAPARTARAPHTDTGLTMDLEWAIARLPDGARAVFVLHDIEGYQHAEIGERLHIAEGTSKAHLFRARRLLRAMLGS